MRYITLEVRTDRETGKLGLMIKGTPMIDYPMVAVEGFLVAHDLIEHQQGVSKIGSIGDELLALGGVWYTRGQHADINRKRPSFHSPEEDLASEVLNMAGLALNGTPLRVKVPHYTHEHDQDDSFETIIEIAQSQFYSEFGKTSASVEWYWEAALHLMRQGYNMAKKRFERKGNRWTANTMFWNIAEAVDSIINNVEYEGQQFRLAYDSTDAHCSEIYPDDDYY